MMWLDTGVILLSGASCQDLIQILTVTWGASLTDVSLDGGSIHLKFKMSRLTGTARGEFLMDIHAHDAVRDIWFD